MKNSTKGILFQLPAIIILAIVVIGSFYIKIKNIILTDKPIGWLTPITLLIIFALYFIGLYMQRKGDNPW